MGEGREAFLPLPKIKSYMESSVYGETKESQDFGKP